MDEELECGCKNTGCHFCDSSDEIYATLKYENAEGAVSCIHICGDCHDDLLRNKLTDKARKELGWKDEVD